ERQTDKSLILISALWKNFFERISMKAIIAVFLLLTVRGVVKDPNGAPVAGAVVTIDAARAVTDTSGAFAIESAHEGTLHVTHAGFQAANVPAAGNVEVTMRPALSDSIVVSGIRADAATPVTKTDVPREEIEKRYYQQDIPLLLRDTPSIDSYAESGVGGAGYSYFSLRGISPTRLNFTLDGVPLADSEDMGTYFADFADLAHSLESIQVQRGVGTSTVGSPSFGGSVNMESISLAQDPQTTATLGIGSYGNRQASVGYQSGTLPGDLALYTRLSYIENEGFRDNSGIRQHNVFLSAAKNLGDAQ